MGPKIGYNTMVGISDNTLRKWMQQAPGSGYPPKGDDARERNRKEHLAKSDVLFYLNSGLIAIN